MTDSLTPIEKFAIAVASLAFAALAFLACLMRVSEWLICTMLRSRITPASSRAQ